MIPEAKRITRLETMPEGADTKACKAAQGYEFCNRLFELERQFEN